MKKLFLTGTFRSGTTLLCSCLNVHPNILVGWQPYWLFFKTCSQIFFRDIKGTSLPDNYPMGLYACHDQTEKSSFKKLFSQLRFTKEELATCVGAIKRDLVGDNEKINKDMKHQHLVKYLEDIQPGMAGEVLSQLYEKLILSSNTCDIDKAVAIGSKEVFCEEFIEPFLEYFGPEGIALHIIRDPRAVVASRNYGKYREATGSKYPIFFIIKTWKRTVTNYLLNKDKPDYLMVRYEDLARDPERQLSRICNLVRIKFSKNMVDTSKFKNSKGNRWQANSSFADQQTISTASINKWQEILPPEQIEIIEFYCKNEMSLLGYATTNDSFEPDRIANFKEDTSQVRSWLKEYSSPP